MTVSSLEKTRQPLHSITSLGKYPVLVGIPITNRCNSECAFCLRKNIPETELRQEKDLSMSQIFQLCEKLKNRVPFLNISAGYGECFLHPQIEDILSIVKKYKISTIAYTNGKQISGQIQYVQMVDRCIISANRYTMFEGLFYSLDGISGIHNVRLSVIIDLPENDFSYLEWLCRSCAERAMPIEMNWLFNYNQVSRKPTEVALHELISLREKYHNIYCAPLSSNLTIQCQDPWRSLYFTKEGNLRKCCIFYESTQDYNIFMDDIDTIWNSQFMEEERNNFKRNTPFRFCAGCPIGYGIAL